MRWAAQMNYAEWLLRDFLVFLERRNCLFMTTQLALEWAILPQQAHASYRARRLTEVRHFGGYAHALDMRHETVPPGLFPSSRHRRQPHIYSDTEICAIIKAAGPLSGRLRPLTYSTLLGLLSVTGMRSGEVVNLDWA